MLTKLYRLLAPEDASPGGGSPPPPASPAPAPAATPAQGPAPTFDTAALAREVAASVRDSVFAELRKSGALKKDTAAAPAPDKDTPPAPAGAHDVEALIERHQSLGLALGKYDIPETALARARQSFKADSPTDVGAWVTTFATDMGWKQRSSAAQPAPGIAAASPPVTPSGPPVTGGGAPPASDPVRSDTPIHKRSIPDREALRREIGDIEYKNRLFREMASVQITGVRR